MNRKDANIAKGREYRVCYQGGTHLRFYARMNFQLAISKME